MTTASPLIPIISPVTGPALLAAINAALGSMRCLVADDAAGGTNVNTAQPWFPTGSGSGVALAAGGAYFFEGRLFATRAAGTNSHTTSLLFGGTATITSIDFWGDARTGDANTPPVGRSGGRFTSASGGVVKAASTSATEDLDAYVQGRVIINGAGTLIPQFIYSAAPGGAPTLKRGSYFLIKPWGISTDDRGGLTWS